MEHDVFILGHIRVKVCVAIIKMEMPFITQVESATLSAGSGLKGCHLVPFSRRYLGTVLEVVRMPWVGRGK